MHHATPPGSANAEGAASLTEAALGGGLERVRAFAPLVHNITNFVVMNTTANALLAIGASPAMVHAVEEVEAFVHHAAAVVINIGTLSEHWADAMRRAADTATAAGVPWILDPVAAGVTPYRSVVAADLVSRRPAVIRGNASEILALAGGGASGKGVDSAHGSAAALEVARRFAAECGCAVAVTGEVDHVTDGDAVASIANGHAMMARVTGLGCTASALIGAFLGAGLPPMEATTAALTALGVAGEIAAAQSLGPGSLQLNLLDQLYRLDRTILTRYGRLT